MLGSPCEQAGSVSRARGPEKTAQPVGRGYSATGAGISSAADSAAIPTVGSTQGGDREQQGRGTWGHEDMDHRQQHMCSAALRDPQWGAVPFAEQPYAFLWVWRQVAGLAQLLSLTHTETSEKGHSTVPDACLVPGPKLQGASLGAEGHHTSFLGLKGRGCASSMSESVLSAETHSVTVK